MPSLSQFISQPKDPVSSPIVSQIATVGIQRKPHIFPGIDFRTVASETLTVASETEISQNINALKEIINQDVATNFMKADEILQTISSDIDFWISYNNFSYMQQMSYYNSQPTEENRKELKSMIQGFRERQKFWDLFTMYGFIRHKTVDAGESPNAEQIRNLANFFLQMLK